MTASLVTLWPTDAAGLESLANRLVTRTAKHLFVRLVHIRYRGAVWAMEYMAIAIDDVVGLRRGTRRNIPAR